MAVFGRPIRDFIPIPPGRYQPHDTWKHTLQAREDALRNRHMRDLERWSEHTRRLPPLVVGDRVRIQNQTGPEPLKWDKTGQITEVRQHDQYVVRVNGSGRVTLRNRKFLRRYIPARQPPPHNITLDIQLTPRPATIDVSSGPRDELGLRNHASSAPGTTQLTPPSSLPSSTTTTSGDHVPSSPFQSPRMPTTTERRSPQAPSPSHSDAVGVHE